MPLTVGMVIAMGVSFALVAKLGRHLLHAGIIPFAAGAVTLALTADGAQSVSTWDLLLELLLSGLGAGLVFGQLFDIILAGVAMDEVGSASGVLNAVQQLANSLGVAVLGTVFFSKLGGRAPAERVAVDDGRGVPHPAGGHLRARLPPADLPMRAREQGAH